jgi:putative ABC transport system permease protein
MLFSTFIFKNLARRPVRSILTCVGVAVAVAALVALLGVSSNFQESCRQVYEKRRVDLLVVRAGKTDTLTSTIPERVGQRLRELPGVEAVTGALADVVSFPEADLIGVLIQAWTPDSFLFEGLKITDGRRLETTDRKAVMLGTVLAQNLGKRAGHTLEIENQKYDVVGVYESFNVFENGSAVLLLPELQALMDRAGQVTIFQMILADAPDKEELRNCVRDEIKAMCDERGKSLYLSALPTREYVQNNVQIRAANGMALLTSAIALVIGTIGVLNTMIMSVFEQTREIGILRAIGWRKGRIMRMILGESLMLCAVGAVVGAVGAVALVRWLSTWAAVSGFIDGRIPPLVVAQGFAIALLVGLLGGIYPAYRGAALCPTEAIRHE